MKSENLTFENMVVILVAELPELREAYEKELSRWGGEMGQHIMYRYVMYDAIERELKSKNLPSEAFLRRLFDFLEKLAGHQDQNVQEVAHNSVCEKICSDEVVLQKSRKYMGPMTLKFCEMIIGRHGE